MYQKVFKRYEIKYLLSQIQKQAIIDAISPYMQLDKYGKTTIRNIYYDTPTYLLIRRSIEKPIYKEKLRIRSYKQATKESNVFVEIKKKYDHIVYKRRLCLPEEEAMNWLNKTKHPHIKGQIVDEIDYFLQYYDTLQPTLFLSYEREAYYCDDDSTFRITFDQNITARRNDLSLESDIYGTRLLDEGMTLMEVKCSKGLPLWLVSVLSKEKIYKTSFSKYGKAYQMMFIQTNNKN